MKNLSIQKKSFKIIFEILHQTSKHRLINFSVITFRHK